MFLDEISQAGSYSHLCLRNNFGQTVHDDSSLLFLYGQCSINETALIMAGLAGLDLCTKAFPANEITEYVTGKSLLSKYLGGIETKLHTQMKRLSHASLFDGSNSLFS